MIAAFGHPRRHGIETGKIDQADAIGDLLRKGDAGRLATLQNFHIARSLGERCGGASIEPGESAREFEHVQVVLLQEYPV